MIDLEQEELDVEKEAGQIAHLEATVAREQKELTKSEEGLKAAVAAQDILQHLAQAVQQQAHQRISEVVSSCLSGVFEDPYSFKIQFERKRGRTEAHLRFLRRGLDVDPLSSSGGGVVDVAAFALRVACLVLHRPKLSKVLVLDEPFRFVSAQYQDAVREMLEQLSKDMGLQIIQITHNDNLATGKVIEV